MSKTAPKRESNQRDYLVIPLDHAAIAATGTLYICDLHRDFKIERLRYCASANVAADATNYDVIQVKKGSTVLGTWSCKDDGEGALTAATPVSLTLNTDDTTLARSADDQLDLVFTKNGTGALPIGRLLVEGYYI